jgi:hypothetical protein
LRPEQTKQNKPKPQNKKQQNKTGVGFLRLKKGRFLQAACN